MGVRHCDEGARKILLMMPPFWPPLMPPLGLATLKGQLSAEGFASVKICDLNTVPQFRAHYSEYLKILKRNIPEQNQGVFGKIVYDVLQNHLLAHKNSGGNTDAIENLVRSIIYQTFYIEVSHQTIEDLNLVLTRFFADLRAYLVQLFQIECPDILGVSVPDVSALAATMSACEIAKEMYPEMLTIMGGSIFLIGLAESPDFDRFLERAPYIDRIVVGAGERSLLKVLRGETGDKRVYLEQQTGFAVSPSTEMTRADFSDFDISLYPYLGTKQSTSCPFQCGFCNVPKFYGQYKKKGISGAVEDMFDLYRTYGSQLIYMVDSLLNPIIGDLTKELLHCDVPLYIDGFVRSQDSLCNPEYALALRRGGLYRARMGIESGSQRILDLMNKRMPIEQATQSVRSLAAAGVKTTVFIVVGYPGETEEDFRQTLDWISALREDIWQLDPSPFTYWYSGQCHDDQWARLRRLLYPQEAEDLLIVQSWTLDCEPSREETYRRLSRLASLCRDWGIPNPYEIKEHHHADRRWKNLHSNAVPSLLEFSRGKLITECREIKDVAYAQTRFEERGEFVF